MRKANLPDTILALDPGQTTGWALWTFGNDPEKLGMPQSGQEDFTGTMRLMNNVITTYPGAQIVAEMFIIGPNTVKKSQAPWSLEVIGCARWAALSTGRELKLQQASSAKRFSADWRLKQLSWYRPGKGHANDALRHLLLYMVSHGWWDQRIGPQEQEDEQPTPIPLTEEQRRESLGLYVKEAFR
jgi:hypothetical protein